MFNGQTINRKRASTKFRNVMSAQWAKKIVAAIKIKKFAAFHEYYQSFYRCDS
jgi:hypothetical protein